ncbi:putative PLATZ transcription factor family protein [Quillaja saponaria]|uniref:PLATZ transcription factor family protein n=1 Tax=Quillaja saponaria TaxID=32244 RepID=A0AAD7KMI3_QUISA|nr:putative PLATZ transcription factor family protein [Quillaja saponaria]
MDWLSSLLGSKFFGCCADHEGVRNNVKNVFCIDCGISLCRTCVEAHPRHQWLQIFKYVFNNVIRLQDMQKYIDCSKVQTYKCNGEQCVHLNSRTTSKDIKQTVKRKSGDISPLPQLEDTKLLTKIKSGGFCEGCGKYFRDFPNRFCSISCKFQVSEVPGQPKDHKLITILPGLSMKDNNSDSESNSNEMGSSSSITIADSFEEIKAWRCSTALKPRKLFHKRKGIPMRSHLF